MQITGSRLSYDHHSLTEKSIHPKKHNKKHFKMVKSASLEKARENKRAVESMQTPVAAARSWRSTETSQIASGNRDACIVS